jgi:thiamine biosynthesis protein ThiS
MTIVLNGEPHEAPRGATVQALLETIGLAPGRVAVEVNGRIASREDFARALLRENDRVEVVHFVGGG